LKNIILVSLSIVALFVLTQVNTLACSCPTVGSMYPTTGIEGSDSDFIATQIAEEFKTATAVFTAEVVSAEYVPIVENRQGVEIKAEALIFKFAVKTLWKGNIEDEIIMPTSVRRYSDGTGSSGSNCVHTNFKVGEIYLLYTVGSIDKLQANVCGTTKLIEKAETDIKELQKLKLEKDSKQKDTKR
jgi:hypothetical protein